MSVKLRLVKPGDKPPLEVHGNGVWLPAEDFIRMLVEEGWMERTEEGLGPVSPKPEPVEPEPDE